MSALAGLWRPGANSDRAADCARMLAAQAPYGPDDRRQWDGADVSIGRNLYRLLPEDRHDGGVVVLPDGARLVADARLDNRRELERALDLEPARARVMADSALLARAWGRWGEDCFDHLVGDYAFAVWRPTVGRLALARDPFGRRPLHYHRSRGLIAFATMPAGLHGLAEVPRSPDIDRLARFLALGPEDGSRTFHDGVERVEPGELVVFDGERRARRPHYRVPHTILRLPKAADYVEAVRERLDEAVGTQSRGAGVHLATHLSSGWDSAAVSATAARLRAVDGGRVTAFTAAPRAGYAGVAPRGRHGDEGPIAARLAAGYRNIDHVVLRGHGRSPFDDLAGDTALSGRPILNACNHVWMNDIHREMRSRGLRVLLTGDFGNLGLTDDGFDALPDLLASGDLAGWWRLARATARTGPTRWPGVVAASFAGGPIGPLINALRRALGRPSAVSSAHSALRPELWKTAARRLAAGRLSRAERRVATLTRMDLAPHAKATLARFGVDVRDPLTDRRLFELCLSLPLEQLTIDGRARGLARRVLADRAPAFVLDLATRGYQAADWHEGLTADRARAASDLERLAGLPAAARLLDIERLRGLLARWPAGGWQRDEVIDAYRAALLRGLAAGRFLTDALGSNA